MTIFNKFSYLFDIQDFIVLVFFRKTQLSATFQKHSLIRDQKKSF